MIRAIFFSRASEAKEAKREGEYVAPVGLFGVTRTIALVFGEISCLQRSTEG